MTIYQVVILGLVLIVGFCILTAACVEIYRWIKRDGLTISDMETSWAEGSLRWDIQAALQHQFTTNGAWMTFCDQCLAEAQSRRINIWIVYREKHAQLQVRQWWTAWCLMWGVIGYSVAAHAAIFEPEQTSEHVKLGPPQ